MTPTEVVEKAKEYKIVDFKFSDLFGAWQHFSIPAASLKEDMFTEGLGFDGSSIRGFQKINESDMLLFPDANFVFEDPFTEVKTLTIVCDVHNPDSDYTAYSRDPRNVAKKAEAYLKSSGIADTAFFGAESEFYIFNEVRYDYKPNSSMHFIDSDEGAWNTARDEAPNLGYKIPLKGGYFPVAPNDQYQDVRTEMMLTMIEAGIDVEVQHHEVGTAGQAEIDLRFQPLLKHADDMFLYKYIVKNVARANGLTATFMPKPLFKDNGSGMHCHQSPCGKAGHEPDVL